jgi:hypothetical protein
VPYRRLIESKGGVAVWRVDGQHVRDHIDVEFTNGAHHFAKPYVPRDEIWIDREAPGAREGHFWALSQRVQRALMSAGDDYLEALRVAERIEIRERRLARGLTKSERVSVTDVRASARRRVIAKIGERNVWLVDGRVVRDLAYVHFTLGGHGFIYRFIPRDEVWIDDAVAPAERAAILHHELVELERMSGEGLAYDDAHAHASRAEVRFRRAERRGVVVSGQ